MSLFHKQESYLGVDIGADGIKVVELKKTKNRPHLWTSGVAHYPIDIHPPAISQTAFIIQDDAVRDQVKQEDIAALQALDGRVKEYSEVLKRLLREAKVTTRRAMASLPVSHVFHTVITLPPVDPKEVAHHVEAKIKKMLPRPLEEMQVVHQVIPDGPEEKEKFLRVLVTAAPKWLVSLYTRVFQQAGLVLEELETEAFALERSLVGREKQAVMVIDIGAERSNFFIIHQGLPLTHRSVHIGGKMYNAILADALKIPVDDVEQVKKDLSSVSASDIPASLFSSVIEPLIKEVEYGMDIFAHQTGNDGQKIEKIVLTGGASLFPLVLATLQQRFTCKSFIGDPWARVIYQQGIKDVLDTMGPQMAVSIGLAMRHFE